MVPRDAHPAGGRRSGRRLGLACGQPHPTVVPGRTPALSTDAPPALRQDAETSGYLDRLTRRVHQLVERVAEEARQAGASDRMPWQRALPPDVDDQLMSAALVIFRCFPYV